MLWMMDHLNKPLAGALTSAYRANTRRKVLVMCLLLILLLLVAVSAIARGTYNIPVKDVLRALTGSAGGDVAVVITHIRLPRVAAAIFCGWGLALSGLCIQSLLRNPLGSPVTMGILYGAACGAAAAIVIFGAAMVSITVSAFAGGMTATVVILILAQFKRLSPAAIILAGVSLHSLFISGIFLIQFLSTDTDLVKVVFWAFGDVARSNWQEIGLLAAVVFIVSLFLFAVRWDMNTLAAGDEIAKGLGVSVYRIRLTGMVVATLLAALVTAFHGVISFLGLVAPHVARRLVGEDHCLLIPCSALVGALLLLLADTLGRELIGSGSLPVGVITSFLGAPLFLYLLVRGNQ
jgi:iron complex transport system permease protein